LVLPLLLCHFPLLTRGEEPAASAVAKESGNAAPGDLPGLKRVAKDYDIWLDLKRKAVVVDGEVCLREGQLEMFACPKGTKEHESVVALNAKPQLVHAALLAVGAKSGTPVKFDPEYQPAMGQVIDIFVLWKDEQGKNQKMRAQEWIKHAKTGKPMPYNWVFAGSGFWKDDDGKEYYYADGGDFICVSNFPSAMLDLPVESSQANATLLFLANTENIPPKGTKIRLVLIPRADGKGEGEQKGREKSDDAENDNAKKTDTSKTGAATEKK
jgi:hypothetical protein